MTRTVLSLAAALSLLAGAASAQNPQPAPPTSPVAPVAPPTASPQVPPEQIAPGNGQSGSSGTGNLSDRLSRQQGTLHPPTSVDPGINAPLPRHAEGTTMPVIPPPGTPGGDPKVVPK